MGTSTMQRGGAGALVLMLLVPGGFAHADGQAGTMDKPPSMNEAEKRIDIGDPPEEAAKDVIANSAGQPMSTEDGVGTKAKVNCGIITCSVYLSRKETHYVAENGMVAAIGAGLITGVAGKALAAAAGLATWKSQQADKKKQCLRVRIAPTPLPPGFGVVGYYSDGSKHCRK